MKVSIIIPFHKGEAYLRDCLESLTEQTYSDMEVIVISDHAPENDLVFLSEYNNKLEVSLYRLENKTGVAAARNLGLAMASGDYLYFLDSDDYLYENTIEELVLAALERNDDIIYGKKKPTWFQRSVFNARAQEEQEAKDQEEENDENELETPDLKMEDDQGDDSEDDSDNEDPTDEKGHAEVDKDSKQDQRDRKRLPLEDEDNQNTEDDLTEEEIHEIRQIRTRRAHRILVTKRKGVRNISVLNILFKRSFIDENNIRFPENFIYFSDLPFLMEALSKTDRYMKRFRAVYIKRKHNDAINYPALSQIRDPNRFNEFIGVYYEVIKRIERESDLKNRFDKKYISYYTRVYSPRLKRSKNDKWREENFIKMSLLAKEMNTAVVRKLRGHKRRLIKLLIKEDIEKSIRIVKVHLGYKKFRKIIRNKKALYKTLYIHIFMKKPLAKNWIVFESFFGKSYSDSPKYIYEYISANFPGKYKCIWIVNKKGSRIPFRHKKVKRFSLRYYYYMARCGYIVFNSRQPEWVVKREGNVFLQTWHGTPLKKLVFDIEDINSASPKYKQQVYKQSRFWDYLIAANGFSSETFKRCFMFDNAMLETGYPRNDILHSADRDQIATIIRKRIGIPKDKKIVLYAPTWRDDEFYGKGQYKFELQINLELMKKELGDEYVFLLRTHYFIADSIDLTSFSGFAYNMSKYDDISELYLISDILITDYSSVFFDFANLKRPMLFYTYDLEKYRDILRGFYIDIEKEVPGPLLFTTEEVVDSIKNIDKITEDYRSRYEVFYNRFCGWEDGQASKKVVESVFKI